MPTSPLLNSIRLSACLLAGIMLPLAPCRAQISSDMTVETNVTQLSQNNFQIEGGRQVGSNLFHSFNQFSVPTSGEAYFNNSGTVTNIISRVTGGSLSLIDGAIRANDSANFYLINPNGIEFGTNASLALGGSFIASTAEQINFADGFTYRTVAPEPSPLLTITAPSGLQFGNTSAPIVNRARRSSAMPQGLMLPTNKTLALIGGDITLDAAALTVPGGHIEISSITQNGVVSIAYMNEDIRFKYDLAPVRGDIEFRNQPFLNIIHPSEGSVRIVGNNIAFNNASTILVFAVPIAMQEQLFSSGIDIDASNALVITGQSLIATQPFLPIVSGPEIRVRAKTFEVSDHSVISTLSAPGISGNIDVNAQEINVKNGGIQGGFINLKGSEKINIEGALIRNRNNPIAERNILSQSGIHLEAKIIVVNDFSRVISRSDLVKGGDISIKSAILDVSNHALIQTIADAEEGGDININSDQVNIFEKGDVFAIAAENTDKRGGDINIQALSVQVKDDGRIRSPARQGAGGDITIEAQNVQVLGDGSQINSRAFRGNAGLIKIKAEDIVLGNGGEITTSTFDTGNAGRIEIEAEGTILVSGKNTDGQFATAISSRSSGKATGNAGSIRIQANQLLVEDGGLVTVGTVEVSDINNPIFGISTGNAGTLEIIASDLIQVEGTRLNENQAVQPSGIIAETQGPGNAGNLIVLTPNLIVKDGGEINVRSLIAGEAGSIFVVADQVSLQRQGKILAETDSGNGGNISFIVRDIFSLREQSLISTSGGVARTLGDGGNIEIDTPILLAFSAENSDISTNAFLGNGGTISITAQGIFGLAFRAAPTDLSDITATSQFGASGRVNLDTLEPDPRNSLNQLPETPVAIQSLERRCQEAEPNTAGQFLVANKGGVAITPQTYPGGTSILNSLVAPGTPSSTKPQATGSDLAASQAQALLEAQGWTRDAQGALRLVTRQRGAGSAIATHPHCNRPV